MQRVTITSTCYHTHNHTFYHKFSMVWGYTLLLADVFENFKNKCIEIYELDPAHFLSAPGLAWQAHTILKITIEIKKEKY